GKIVAGGGFGVIGDIAVGIVGALIGSWLMPHLGIRMGSGIVSAIIVATIGSVLLLVVVGLVSGAYPRRRFWFSGGFSRRRFWGRKGGYVAAVVTAFDPKRTFGQLADPATTPTAGRAAASAADPATTPTAGPAAASGFTAGARKNRLAAVEDTKALGITVPQSEQSRADEVIE